MSGGVTLSIGLNYGGPKRQMTIAYAPGCTSDQVPMLKLANRFLLDSGFTVGSKCNVEYGRGVITISKLNESIK